MVAVLAYTYCKSLQHKLHGTSKAEDIAAQGFDDRMNRRALYGIGVYLTIESCKAAQYSEGGTIIVTKALLGHPYMAQGPMETHLRRPNVEGMDVPHDSTIVAPGPPNGKGKATGRGATYVWVRLQEAARCYECVGLRW